MVYLELGQEFICHSVKVLSTAGLFSISSMSTYKQVQPVNIRVYGYVQIYTCLSLSITISKKRYIFLIGNIENCRKLQ